MKHRENARKREQKFSKVSSLPNLPYTNECRADF